MIRTNTGRPRHSLRTLVFIWAVSIMLAFTVAESAGITAFSRSGEAKEASRSQGTPQPDPSSSPSDIPKSALSPDPASSSDSESPSPLQPGDESIPASTHINPVWVANLALAGKSSDLKAPAMADVRGVQYSNSIVFECAISCTDDSASVSAVAPHGRSKLIGSVGILDSAPTSDEVGTFSVAIDGREAWSTEAGVGAPHSFEIPVDPGARVTFTATRPGSVTNPALVGLGATVGQELPTPHLAWLDPAFTG